MNCCSSGSSLAGVAAVIGAVVIADRVCVWVADRIWWIGGMVVVSFALAVAISMWLESLAERRGARFAERHGIRSRADVIQVEPVSDRKVATYLSPVAVPAALPPAGPAVLGCRSAHALGDGRGERRRSHTRGGRAVWEAHRDGSADMSTDSEYGLRRAARLLTGKNYTARATWAK